MKTLKSLILGALVAMTGAWSVQAADICTNCITFSADKAFGIRLKKGASASAVNLQYSTNQEDWATFNDNTDYAAANVGGIYKLHIRGTSNGGLSFDSDRRYIRAFTNTVNSVATEIACSGNIETLLDYATVASGGHPSMNNYAFCNLFNGFTTLTSAPDLLGTTQTKGCYLGMFKNCTSLRSAPAIIPGTISQDNSCAQIFYNCTSMTNAPVLPAMTMVNACYSYMFYGCASLREPPALPATTLAGSCYMGMFGGCKSLKSAPALPVTTLAIYCYSSMFNGCTALTNAPALPATTLADSCYKNMFRLCTQLTDIPALNVSILTNTCCGNMFANCSNLVVNTTGPGKVWKIPSTAQIVGTATISGKTYWATNMFANTAGDVGAGAEIVPGKTYYVGATKVKDLGDDLALWQYEDDYGVKGEGVLTSDKTKDLAGLGVRGLFIGDGITSIGDYAFQKFYALTNVTCAASVTSVGIGAFSRCLGIEALTFEGTKPTLGEKAFTIRAGIRMEGDEPVIYPIPKVTYAGDEPTLYGKTNLTDVAWQTVMPANKGDFHFFTYDPPSK